MWAAFVVVMTPDAEVSPWVRRELEQAQVAKRPIFPLLLEGRQFPSLDAYAFLDVTGGAMPGQRFGRYLSDLAAGRSVERRDRGGVWVARDPISCAFLPGTTTPAVVAAAGAHLFDLGAVH